MMNEYVGIYNPGEYIEVDKIIQAYKDVNGDISHDIEMYICGLISGNRAVLTILYVNKPLSLYMGREFYQNRIIKMRDQKINEILK